MKVPDILDVVSEMDGKPLVYLHPWDIKTMMGDSPEERFGVNDLSKLRSHSFIREWVLLPSDTISRAVKG